MAFCQLMLCRVMGVDGGGLLSKRSDLFLNVIPDKFYNVYSDAYYHDDTGTP